MPHSIFLSNPVILQTPCCQQTCQKLPIQDLVLVYFGLRKRGEARKRGRDSERTQVAGSGEWQALLIQAVRPFGSQQWGRQTLHGRAPWVPFGRRAVTRLKEHPSATKWKEMKLLHCSAASHQRGERCPQDDSTQQILPKDNYGMQIFRNPVVV